MRTLLFAMLALLTLAPLAAAQDETKEDPQRPEDAAWTEDCPPDMMCAYGGGEDEPIPYGNESCIECSGPSDAPREGEGTPVEDGANCMDGQQEGETCRDDVQYLGGPTRGPADGSCEYCRGEENVVTPPEGAEGGVTSVQDEAAENAVPAAGLGLIVAAFAVAVVLVARKL